MNPLLSHRQSEIEKVELTPEELSLVIWQAKYVKWNKERFRDYWESMEKKKAEGAYEGDEGPTMGQSY